MSTTKERYYRKRVDFYLLINKIKLWPSRTGVLHGIRKIVKKGKYAEVTTHCGHTFQVRLSKNSRAARWLRNKWVFERCRSCRIPAWKIEKFAATRFTEHYGSDIRDPQ